MGHITDFSNWKRLVRGEEWINGSWDYNLSFLSLRPLCQSMLLVHFFEGFGWVAEGIVIFQFFKGLLKKD